MENYEVAQICLNGHCINSNANSFASFNSAFCPICGAETTMSCSKCKAPIRGKYPGIEKYVVPNYCHNCGKPYPWTESAIQAAAELLTLDDNLSIEETQILVDALPDLLSETPKTQLAVAKFKKFLSASGRFTVDGVRQFAIDFGCAYVKSELSKLGL